MKKRAKLASLNPVIVIIENVDQIVNKVEGVGLHDYWGRKA